MPALCVLDIDHIFFVFILSCVMGRGEKGNCARTYDAYCVDIHVMPSTVGIRTCVFFFFFFWFIFFV